MKCPYCNGVMFLTDSKVIYGVSHGLVWLCEGFPGCDTYVGIHKGTITPLGTPADWKLRQLRKQCHDLLDPYWKEGCMSRTEAYDKVAELLGIDREDAHIGKLNKPECRRLIHYIKKGALRI